jgi:hypothetical protein
MPEATLFDRARQLRDRIQRAEEEEKAKAHRELLGDRASRLVEQVRAVEAELGRYKRAVDDGLAVAAPPPPPVPSPDDPVEYLSSDQVIVLERAVAKTADDLGSAVARSYALALDALEVRVLTREQHDFFEGLADDDREVLGALDGLAEASEKWSRIRTRPTLPGLDEARRAAEEVETAWAQLTETLQDVSGASAEDLVELQELDRRLSSGQGVPLVQLDARQVELLRQSGLDRQIWLKKR